MPAYAIYVGRPTKWGNPFDWREYRESWPFDSPSPMPHSDEIDRDTWCKNQATQEFKDAIERGEIVLPLHELRGKTLACWCAGTQWCHGDVLLELAND